MRAVQNVVYFVHQHARRVGVFQGVLFLHQRGPSRPARTWTFCLAEPDLQLCEVVVRNRSMCWLDKFDNSFTPRKTDN